MKRVLMTLGLYLGIASCIYTLAPVIGNAATQIDGALEAGVVRILQAGLVKFRLLSNSNGDLVFENTAAGSSAVGASPKIDGATGGLLVSSGTFAQLQALTPAYKGELFILSDAVGAIPILCMSTGTTLGSVALATQTVTQCK